MTISELSSRAGVPVSTIKFYIREGLIPRPVKTGETRAFYTGQHLDRLELVQKIRKEGTMTLQQIRGITELIDSWEKREPRRDGDKGTDQRAAIIRAATTRFREKGYEAVTIADIVDAARIGRSTFYKQFRNKKELFIECIREIILREGVPEDRSQRPEQDGLALFDRSAEAYFREGTLWQDMIRRLRAAAINNPEEFEGILEDAMQLKINRFKKRVQKSMQDGFMRPVNPTLLAVMILGIQETCSEYVSRGLFRETPKSLFEQIKDILLHGTLKTQEPPGSPQKEGADK